MSHVELPIRRVSSTEGGCVKEVLTWVNPTSSKKTQTSLYESRHGETPFPLVPTRVISYAHRYLRTSQGVSWTLCLDLVTSNSSINLNNDGHQHKSGHGSWDITQVINLTSDSYFFTIYYHQSILSTFSFYIYLRLFSFPS